MPKSEIYIWPVLPVSDINLITLQDPLLKIIVCLMELEILKIVSCVWAFAFYYRPSMIIWWRVLGLMKITLEPGASDILTRWQSLTIAIFESCWMKWRQWMITYHLWCHENFTKIFRYIEKKILKIFLKISCKHCVKISCKHFVKTLCKHSVKISWKHFLKISQKNYEKNFRINAWKWNNVFFMIYEFPNFKNNSTKF